MKINVLWIALLLFCCKNRPAAITFELNGGRFGDNISTYCKAKIFSYKYDIPLLYTPFEYSDQLTLDLTETKYSTEKASSFDAIVSVKTEDDVKKNKNKNVLLVINFYTSSPGLYEYGFNNPSFAYEIKQLLTPINLPDSIEKNNNEVTIALHVRKGGGFDAPLASEQSSKKPGQYADQQWPTKFPPDQFYIDQLRMMRKLIAAEKKMIIYLFTDDRDPEKLAKRYQEKLSDIPLVWRYRTTGNSHNAHVVEDFYLMAQCDCLIRSTSLLARASQLLGKHEIIIYPITGYWVEDTLTINPVGIIMRDSSKEI